ncbi:copper chaperone PCu(A)C [Streptomyces justiciae]|uniref:Copper chaperone PCu(A)C n=1 Tax=Streptomyces justiciae TaxID=2780140 RepID=A0ABU3M329_9ACTN|nr:copper chaperone PCu(A)C [Streptomyces justiciae]MBE8478285.1 copper chaperone PCu(A)C [Streptomyces justiciae]MCW8375690.1 copper chaperone PCu(A)C [Streptomyces justiciae]MDT7845911.1 copper chaperone PCu(A)C [Streptomyces justiciae]
MSSSLRRGALAAAAIAFSIASLAACGAGNNAQTLEIKPDNAATTVGDIKVQNAVVITQPDLESTGPAVISATLFNSGTSAQTLDAITVDGAGAAELSAAKGKGKLTIPAGGSLVLGGKDNATAVLSSGRESLKDGDAQKVTFSFSKTGDVSLQAFVVPAKTYFEKWGPTEKPSTPAETSPSPTESATGSATPSGEASASASASASESAAE